jgi:hypothetical protein
MTGTAAKDMAAPNTFTDEADSLVNRDCTHIVFDNPQVQTLQIESFECVAAKETCSFDTYSLASPPFLADQDAEFGNLIEPVNAVQIAVADQAIIAFGFDSKNDARVRPVLDGLPDPFRLGCPSDWKPVSQDTV